MRFFFLGNIAFSTDILCVGVSIISRPKYHQITEVEKQGSIPMEVQQTEREM